MTAEKSQYVRTFGVTTVLGWAPQWLVADSLRFFVIKLWKIGPGMAYSTGVEYIG